jgi:hypothetical protein
LKQQLLQDIDDREYNEPLTHVTVAQPQFPEEFPDLVILLRNRLFFTDGLFS